MGTVVTALSGAEGSGTRFSDAQGAGDERLGLRHEEGWLLLLSLLGPFHGFTGEGGRSEQWNRVPALR